MIFIDIAEALKQELRNECDQILTNDTKETADKINLNKIEKIVAALNVIEPDHVADDREAFKEKFNKRHGKKILKTKETQKKSFYYYIGKVACWVISISIAFAGANTITGLATGKSICTRIVETWQTMEYTHYKNNKEPSNIQSEDEFQDYKEINTALSFDEIRKSINSKYDFQEPHYIPKSSTSI